MTLVYPIIKTLELLDLDSLSDYRIIELINSNKPKGHSASRVVRNSQNRVLGFGCDCGRKSHHPILDNNIIWSVTLEREDFSFYSRKSFLNQRIEAE